MWHSRNHEESKDYRHCGGRGGHFRGGFGRFGHGRGHGHDGGGFGRRRGLYDSDELRLVLLSLIAEKPRHGYDLIKEIEERSGGAYTPSPGVIYPTLTMLQDMGHIVRKRRGWHAQSLCHDTRRHRSILPRTRSMPTSLSPAWPS